MPENMKEFEVLAKEIRARNISEPHAIDGELSPKCKAKYYAAEDKGASFNVTTINGECNYKKNLYFFDDEFTDPTFVLSVVAPDFPVTTSVAWISDEPKFRTVGECLNLEDTHSTGKREDWSVVNSNYCAGAKLEEGSDGVKSIVNSISSVICGRRPF
uniref:C-type lectin domain-containing protein n=2 Tax=Caenorhabditis tropicalis TaxID=1561998 RepID=A0A1I7UDK8_9PELO